MNEPVPSAQEIAERAASKIHGWFGHCLFYGEPSEIKAVILTAITAAVAQREELIEQLKQEDVRRIKHLNRLGTWAQQDPTGPLCAGEIQEWVLNELKAALGSEYVKTAWQPTVFEADELRDSLNKTGVAIGNEHGRYSLRERIEWLASVKEYNVRQVDELRKQLAAAVAQAKEEEKTALSEIRRLCQDAESDPSTVISRINKVARNAEALELKEPATESKG